MKEQQPIKTTTKVDLENRVPLNLFTEEQKFEQLWIWLLLGGSAAAVILPLIIQVSSGDPVGSKPASNVVLGVVSFMMIVLVILFARLKLKTTIDQNAIRMSYGILGSQNVKWSDVESVDVVNYGFVGYGLRYSNKYSKVYNVAGKYGLFIKLKKGGRFVIGTQKKEELEAFLGQIGRGLS